jgi:hypothetical protein
MSHVSAIHMLYYKDLVNVTGKKKKDRTVICAALMLQCSFTT